jgi:hypothetical protein
LVLAVSRPRRDDLGSVEARFLARLPLGGGGGVALDLRACLDVDPDFPVLDAL